MPDVGHHIRWVEAFPLFQMAIRAGRAKRIWRASNRLNSAKAIAKNRLGEYNMNFPLAPTRC
jgi:hypothetical protein